MTTSCWTNCPERSFEQVRGSGEEFSTLLLYSGMMVPPLTVTSNGHTCEETGTGHYYPTDLQKPHHHSGSPLTIFIYMRILVLRQLGSGSTGLAH
jgi:hypothetical protein